MGSDARQAGVSGKQRGFELVVVVIEVGEHAAVEQQTIGQPVAGAGHQPHLEHIEIFRTAQRLRQRRFDAVAEAIGANTVAAPERCSIHRLDALLPERLLLAERLSRQLFAQAGDVGLRRDQRQMVTPLGDSDRVDPVGQVIDQNTVGAIHRFARIAIAILFAGHV